LFLIIYRKFLSWMCKIFDTQEHRFNKMKLVFKIKLFYYNFGNIWFTFLTYGSHFYHLPWHIFNVWFTFLPWFGNVWFTFLYQIYWVHVIHMCRLLINCSIRLLKDFPDNRLVSSLLCWYSEVVVLLTNYVNILMLFFKIHTFEKKIILPSIWVNLDQDSRITSIEV